MEDRAAERTGGLGRNLANSNIVGVVSCLTVSVVAIHFVTANAQPSKDKTVRGGQFVLEDESGKIRVKIAMDDNQPFIALYDDTQKEQVRIATAKNSAGIIVSQGKQKIVIAAKPSGPMIEFLDTQGEPTFTLAYQKSKGITLDMMNRNGSVRAHAGEAPEDASGFDILDNKRNLRVALGYHKENCGVRFYDALGKTRGDLGFLANAPKLVFLDPAENIRMKLVAEEKAQLISIGKNDDRYAALICADGYSGMEIHDMESTKVRAAIMAKNQGVLFSLYDTKTPKSRVSLAVDATKPGFLFVDENRKSVLPESAQKK